MAPFEKALTAGIELLVGRVVVPVTSIIPVLVRTGFLLAMFAALWLAFIAAMLVTPATLDQVSRATGELPLLLQLVAWVLLMPLMAGLWIWGTDWPLVVRVVLVVAIAGWNVLVMVPRPERTASSTAQ